MKTLKDVDETKNAVTGRASDVFRQLAFAGFAVVWIMRDTQAAIVPLEFAPAVAMFALGLSLDALQYGVGSLMWVVFYNRQYELNKDDSAKVDIPGPMNWPSYTFFWLKMLAIAGGWGLLADAALVRWHWEGIFGFA